MTSKYSLLLMLMLSAFVRANAGEDWQLEHKKITGVYGVYGGGLGDPVAPTAKDTKIMFSVDGKMAKEIFDATGPDVKDACTEKSGIRVRKKDHENISCSRTAKGEYYCNFGFDLRTGKSIGGVVC